MSSKSNQRKRNQAAMKTLGPDPGTVTPAGSIDSLKRKVHTLEKEVGRIWKERCFLLAERDLALKALREITNVERSASCQDCGNDGTLMKRIADDELKRQTATEPFLLQFAVPEGSTLKCPKCGAAASEIQLCKPTWFKVIPYMRGRVLEALDAPDDEAKNLCYCERCQETWEEDWEVLNTLDPKAKKEVASVRDEET